MKQGLLKGFTVIAVALGLLTTTAAIGDIEDVGAQPTLFWNMSFDGAGDESTKSALGFRVDYDLSQVTRRWNNQMSIPAMLEVEYAADGKVWLRSNGVPLNQHDYRLNAEEGAGFGALDFVGMLGALAAGYFVYDNIENDDDDNDNNGGSGSGSGGGAAAGAQCTVDSDCASGTCTIVAGNPTVCQ